MPPLVDSAIGADQAPRPGSSSSIVSPSFSSFQFNTIGKTPNLLKRISAPQPNQDYQDESTPSPSPSHLQTVTSSKLSLFQRLTNGIGSETNTVSHTIGNAPSDLNPGTSTSAFDPVFAALFSANVPTVQSLSIPAITMGRRPRSSSDMDMSSAGTTPRIARSLSLTQPAPTDGAVGLITDNTRFTSADLMNGLELAYPATEYRLSASQEPFDSHNGRLSTDADASPDQRFSIRLDDVITCLEPKSLQQSKVLAAITSLEKGVRLVASKSSLVLENAKRAEVAVEKSLSIAKDAVAVAQQSVAAANAAITEIENAWVALVHLRQCHADEHAANEHNHANLLCKMTSLKLDMAPSPNQRSSCNTDTEPPGLGSDLLQILSTEAMKLLHERDPGAKKRKRSSDQMDPSSTCDLASRPSKDARHEHPTLFFDRTVESEAEAAREAWVQEAERRSAVPPDPAQRTAHEQTEKEAMTRGRKNEDNHGQAARSGSTQGQLVNEDVDMSSDKLDAPSVVGSEENVAHESSYSEDNLETSKGMRAQWEREVEEHKLEIARFHIQERALQEKKDKQKEAEGMATTVSEQTEQSAPLRTRPPPTFVPATTTAVERNTQQTAQPKPGLSDVSRMKEVKTRLALEKQKALPAIGQGSSLAPSGAQTISQQNVLQEALRSVADTGRSDFQGQGQTGNDGATGKEQEQGVKGRETDDGVTVAKPRGPRGSADAKDTSKLSIGNVTAQKTLVDPTSLKTAISLQRGKTSVPQNTANIATANIPVSQMLLHPPYPPFSVASQFSVPPIASSMNYGSFTLNDPLIQSLQPQDQDTRQASLPPIACIMEPDQAESDSAIKRPPSSRIPQQKRKQGAKKAAKPRQNVSNIREMSEQQSSTEPDSHKKAATSNGPAVPPLTLPSTFPKSEVISPTLPSFDQRTPAQEAQKSSSDLSIQPVNTSPQQNEHIDGPTPMSIPQLSRDSHHVLLSGEPRSKPPSETVERGLRVESTNALQPLSVNRQVVAAAERVSNPPSKTALTIPGQTGNASAFLKTPHGGHREISGTTASSKPPSRSDLVDHSVSGKAPLPTNSQVAHGEVFTNLHATAVDSSFGAPAANINIPTACSSIPPADVSTSLNSLQTLRSNGPSTGVPTQDSNPLRLAINHSQQPTYPKPARPEARLFRSRSRSRSSPSSSPSPITNRKRSWNVMQGDHWSPGQEAPRRRARMPPPRSRSPIHHVPLSQRLSESTDSHVGRNTSSYWPNGDTYRPDESPPYYEDDIDRHRYQSKSLLHRVTPNTQDPFYRQDHNEFVPPKRSRLVPPHSNSREGRGGARPLEERIS